MNAIIVDDELQSRRALSNLLSRNHPEVKIVATGENVEEGCQLIRKHNPGLAFLDIEMPDGLGFDLLSKMKVHRSHLVNLHFVDRFVKADGGYLVMKDGAQVSVSRVYRDELLERLEQYLDTEAMRFEDTIGYEFIVGEGLDPDNPIAT